MQEESGLTCKGIAQSVGILNSFFVTLPSYIQVAIDSSLDDVSRVSISSTDVTFIAKTR